MFRKQYSTQTKPGTSLLGASEVVGIVLLSAAAHFGLWWLYSHHAFDPTAMAAAGSKAQAVTVTLAAAPKEEEKQPEQPESKPEPTPEPVHESEPKPEPKPVHKPKPQPKPEPKPVHKPKPKPKPKPVHKPEPKPKPTPKTQIKSQSSTEHKRTAESKAKKTATVNKSEADKITPAVSGLRSLNNTPPTYPRRALRRRKEGTVKLKILVTPQGTAGKIEVISSSGSAALDRAAVKTVKKWRFKPAKRGNTPIAGYALQTINFKLPQ